MMNNVHNNCRYRLISQSRDNQLEIEVLGENYRLLRNIHDIFSDKNLLNGFSQGDINIINAIANEYADTDSVMECSE